MSSQTTEELVKKTCAPCEGGIPRLSADEARRLLNGLDGWRLTHDGQRIRRDWRVKDFASGIEFLDRVATLAENEWHHPDLHIEGFRNVWIEISTHAIGGLSENDFILAAKIDQLPVELKS
jgi:4a-hydroxytetrahydrobiopterin dehydratase